MIPVGCQRWRNKRTSYRPTGETIRPADYEVVSLDTVGAPESPRRAGRIVVSGAEFRRAGEEDLYPVVVYSIGSAT